MNKTKISKIGIVLVLSLMSIIGFLSALTITSVSTNPTQIGAGEFSDISIVIKNDANYDITDVSVSLDLEDSIASTLPFAPYGSSSEDSFDEILEDKSKTAMFKVIALNNAKSGIYKIPVVITYYNDQGIKQTKNSLISLTINSKPIIGVNVEEGVFLKNQDNKVIVRVTNKGLSDIKFLEISIKESSYYKILSPKNAYIGDINSDDYDSIEFSLYFNDNSPSSVNIPVNLEYKDSVNNIYSEDYTLQAKVYTSKQAGDLGLIAKSNTSTYVFIGLVIIISWFIYRKIRKNKKKNNSNGNIN